MGRYKAYPEYKDSGVDSLGPVPSHWEVMQLKRSVNGCLNGIWGSEPKNDGFDTIVIRVADFNRQKLAVNDDGFTFRKIEEKEKFGRLLKKGDLLLEKSGGGEKTLVGQVVLFDKDFEAVTSNFVAKMTPAYGFDGRYLNYVFCRFYSHNLNYGSIKQNTGIQNLDSASYLTEKFGFPNLDEQLSIANFLDHETAKIDTLIEQQQQLIQLLKEKRQAVISHAVTKGLSSLNGGPNAPMKDSGVEWLGEVPAHWDVMPIKYACELIKDGTHLPPPRVADGIPLLSVRNIVDGHFVFRDDDSNISVAAYEALCKSFIPMENDVVLAIVGATLGKVAQIAKMSQFHVQRSVAIFRTKQEKLLPTSLRNIFDSSGFQSLLWEYVGFSAQPGIYLGTLENFQIPVPPKEEQDLINSYCQEQSSSIDLLIKHGQKAVNLMQERRTALISAAVTGKIDVRNWQAPQQ